MEEIICCKCNSKDFFVSPPYRICKYCGTQYKMEAYEYTSSTTIDISSDVELLLHKCIKDPFHAKRYANLILDIDPTNIEARRILDKWE